MALRVNEGQHNRSTSRLLDSRTQVQYQSERSSLTRSIASLLALVDIDLEADSSHQLPQRKHPSWLLFPGREDGASGQRGEVADGEMGEVRMAP